LAALVEPTRFSGQIRYWNPERSSGLAVVDVPEPHVAALGGLKQRRVGGTIAGAGFVSNVMPAGGGLLALSVSRAMMTAAGSPWATWPSSRSRTSVGPDAARWRASPLHMRVSASTGGRRS
jgi:hypothetical protein